MIRSMQKSVVRAAAAAAVALAAVPAMAATVQVSQIQTYPGTPAADAWYSGDVAAGSSAIVDLTGAGGNLEAAAPLPPEAVRVTTTANTADKAEIYTAGNFGLASSTLNAINLGYNFYKTASPGAEAPAPAIKLTVQGTGSGDNFGQLVYEPYINPTFNNPTPDTWTPVSITPTSGLFWWTGGYEIGSSAGGPPYRTLSDWALAFAASDPADFPGASVTAITVGLGSNNVNQVNYFDNVSVNVPSIINTTYDFVPEPASLSLLAFGGVALLGRRRRAVR
jgi:hypothetical protein